MRPEGRRVGRVLVTGANGFLGSALCHRLAGRTDVLAFRGPPTHAPALPGGMRVIEGDILDGSLLTKALEGVDTVVHLAGPPSVRQSFEMPLRFVRVHVEGTASVLEACRGSAVGRVVYVSSAEVYGTSAPSPVDEEAPLRPSSPYAAAKVAAEAYADSMQANPGLSIAILRPFSVYGRGQPYHTLLAELLEQVQRRDPSLRLRDPRPVRDLIHVRDVAVALELACSASLMSPVRAFNVGSGVGLSTLTLALTVAELSGMPPEIAVREADRPPSAQTHELIADTRRAKRELGFESSVTLRDGLIELLNDLQ